MLSGPDRKAPVFLSREELEEKDIICPFWYARYSTCMAVAESYHEYNRRENSKEHLRDIEDLEKDIEQVNSIIERFSNKYDASKFYVPALRPAIIIPQDIAKERAEDVDACLSAIMKAKDELSEKLEKLRAYAAANVEALSRTGTDGFVMHQTFAERIGMMWCDLTGKRPSPGQSRFIELLKRCYMFAGGSVHRRWDNIVETICNRMDETPEKYKSPLCGGWDRGGMRSMAEYIYYGGTVGDHQYKFRRGGLLRRMVEMYTKSPAGSDEKMAAYRHVLEETQVDLETDFGKKWMATVLTGGDLAEFWEKERREREDVTDQQA